MTGPRIRRYIAPVTRPHSYEGCSALAPLLARGRSIADIARETELAVHTVQTRIKAMRARLKADGDLSWLDYKLRTHTEVGAEWIRRGWGDEPPPA